MTTQSKNSPIEIIYAAVAAINIMPCYLKIVYKKKKKNCVLKNLYTLIITDYYQKLHMRKTNIALNFT